MIAEAVQDIFDILFGTGENFQLILIKVSIWLLIFFTIFKGAEKVFKGNRAVPMLVAAIISFIGIRFMPDEWFNNIMGVYAIVVGIALLLGPYIIITIITDAARLGKTIKWILVIVAYGALIYFLPSFGVLGVGSDALDTFLRYLADNRVIAGAVFLAILILLIMLRRKLYRGAGYGARGVRWGLRGIGRAGIGTARGVGRGVASGARYLGEGAAFGAGAAGGAGARAGRGMLARMMARRRAARVARRMMRGAERRRGGPPYPSGGPPGWA